MLIDKFPFNIYSRLFASIIRPIMNSNKIEMTTVPAAKALTYSVREVGARNSIDYRCYVVASCSKPSSECCADTPCSKEVIISPMHDIPLWSDEEAGIANMVVEIPRFSQGKLEICKEKLLNPIVQDVKKGKLRFVKNCHPYKGYLWNYGTLPQTWESPLEKDEGSGALGDNDPIDVIEIGRSIGRTGEVKQVKILGGLAMLDEGESDWKLLAIDVTDPLSKDLNDIEDIERLMPGLIESSVRWFKVYKVPDGKPLNQFAFGGKAKKRDFVINTIMDTHRMWKDLVGGAFRGGDDDKRKEGRWEDCEKISIANRLQVGTPELMEDENDPSLPKSDCPDLSNKLKDHPLPADIAGFSYIPAELEN